MSFRKIWIAYGLSLLWMWLGIGAANLSQQLHNLNYSENILGVYIGEFIFVTTPLFIVFSYDQIKKHKEKIKHAVQ